MPNKQKITNICVSSEEQNMKISKHIKGELTLDHFIKTESVDVFF